MTSRKAKSTPCDCRPPAWPARLLCRVIAIIRRKRHVRFVCLTGARNVVNANSVDAHTDRDCLKKRLRCGQWLWLDPRIGAKGVSFDRTMGLSNALWRASSSHSISTARIRMRMSRPEFPDFIPATCACERSIAAMPKHRTFASLVAIHTALAFAGC